MGPIWSFTTEDAPIQNWNVEITSTPVPAQIWVDGVYSGFSTPHTFSVPEGSSALYSVVNPLYTWDAPWNSGPVMGNMSHNFNGVLIPVYWNVEITSTPVPAEIWVDGVYSGFSTPHTFSVLEGTSALYSVVNPLYTWDAPWNSGPVMGNMSHNFNGVLIPIYWNVEITSSPVPAQIWVGGVYSGFSTPHTFSVLEGSSALYSVVNPLYTWDAAWNSGPVMGNMSHNFNGILIPTTYTVYVFSNPSGAEIFVDGVSTGQFTTPGGTPIVLLLPGPHMITLGPVVVDNVTYYFPAIPATSEGQQLSFEGNVPVELSSFTATVTSDLFVNLVWVVQSETQVLGYNIYRAGTSDVAASSRVNNQIINANNLSTQQTYSFVDDTEGLAVNNTYYYWLENVDLTGMVNLYGPRMVTITGTVTPPLPTSSVLNNAYPNPFRMGGTANIGIKVAEGETGTLTIFNLLGQKIVEKTYSAGEFNYEWNAKGNASGIYFYKLSTPSTNVTKKLVIVN